MDPARALAAYNAGPNSKFFQTGDVKDLPDETVKYVKRIITMSGGSLPPVIIDTQMLSNNRRLNLLRKQLHHLKSKSQE
jgi:hypothetical protein